jgi:CDP-4-dehydro-6-deoxyglucose reductase
VDKPILLIAGGGGYSPINGILKYLIEIKSPIKIHLFWGAGILEHLYNHDYLLELDKKHDNFSYTPVLNNLENNNTQDLWKGENGLVIDSVIKKYPDLKNYIIHMAGPVPMCIDAKNKLLNANLDINNLYCDVLDLI